MKRSNRLILLIGFALAIAAFAGIFVLLQNGTSQTPPPVTTSAFVVAAQDIPLGTQLTKEMLATREVPKGTEPADSFNIPERIVGQIIRVDVKKDAYIQKSAFSDVASQASVSTLLQSGFRAMAVKVDQVSGVGTLIHTGDYVDVLMGLGSPAFPVVETDPTTKAPIVVPGINTASVLDIIQNVQVIATLDSVPSAAAAAPPNGTDTTAAESGTPATDEASQIVVIAVTAEQAEVIRFAQIDPTNNTIALVLRATRDQGAPPDETGGVTLRRLVDRWGVLPPQVVETVLPK